MRKAKEQPSSWSINDVSTWRSMPARSASVARFENIHEVSKVSDSSEQSKDEQLSPTPLYSSLQDGHSSNTLKKTLQDILNPARLDALEACDVQPVPYDSYSFSSYIFTLKGRNLSMILSPLLALLLWGLGWQLLFMFLPKGDSYNEVIGTYESDLQRTLSSVNDLISTLVTPVSFLLVFRLGRAAIRFWDARQATGLMIEKCRSNIATVTVGFISPIRQERRYSMRQKQRSDNTETNDGQRDERKGDTDKEKIQSAKIPQPGAKEIELLCEYARWLTSFPVAVKHFLRPEERLGWDDTAYYKKQRFEIGPLLCDEDANHIMLSYEDERGQPVFDRNAKRVRDPPLVVLNRLHELSYDIAHHDYDEDNKGSFNPTPQQRAAFFQQLNNQINILCASFGTMERIKNTPLPFVYVIHLRSILLLYLFLWNMTSIASIGWVALPALFAFNLSMLGIEAASVECERPFDWNSNHLTMGKFCILIARNIAQAMKEVRY